MANMTVGDLQDLIKNLDRDTPVCIMRQGQAYDDYLTTDLMKTEAYTGYKVAGGPVHSNNDAYSHIEEPDVDTEGDTPVFMIVGQTDRNLE